MVSIESAFFSVESAFSWASLGKGSGRKPLVCRTILKLAAVLRIFFIFVFLNYFLLKK